MIEAAAIRADNGDVVSLARPNRHHNIISEMREEGYSYPDVRGSNQGFITNGGRFVNREEAREIAIQAGQTDERRCPHRLYTEDLW